MQELAEIVKYQTLFEYSNDPSNFIKNYLIHRSSHEVLIFDHKVFDCVTQLLCLEQFETDQHELVVFIVLLNSKLILLQESFAARFVLRRAVVV